MVNNPILYAAIMTLACSTSRFLFIYCVSRIGNVISVVVPAATCLLVFGSFRAIIIARWSH